MRPVWSGRSYGRPVRLLWPNRTLDDRWAKLPSKSRSADVVAPVTCRQWYRRRRTRQVPRRDTLSAHELASRAPSLHCLLRGCVLSRVPRPSVRARPRKPMEAFSAIVCLSMSAMETTCPGLSLLARQPSVFLLQVPSRSALTPTEGLGNCASSPQPSRSLDCATSCGPEPGPRLSSLVPDQCLLSRIALAPSTDELT